MKKPKPEKRRCPGIQDSKTVFINKNSDQNSNLWNFLHCKCFIYRFHQAVFKKFYRSQVLSNLVFKDKFGILNYQGKQIIIFVFLVLGMVKRNCRAKYRAKVVLVQHTNFSVLYFFDKMIYLQGVTRCFDVNSFEVIQDCESFIKDAISIYGKQNMV